MLLLCFQLRVSAVLNNAPFVLNLDCNHYVNNSKVVREAMCFFMDIQLGNGIGFVQFPLRFDSLDRNDRYANKNTVLFDVSATVLAHSLSFYHSFCFSKFISFLHCVNRI